MDLTLRPGGALSGDIAIPGDKSISHRALILAAIADGQSTIIGLLKGADVLATASVLQQMGVTINFSENDSNTYVNGVGLYGLQAPKKDLYVGNSGTSIRLLAGLLSGQSFSSRLIGDASLMTRPMKRITVPLSMMGADIHCSQNGTPPLEIQGCTLSGLTYQLPIASAQLKSCLLLAGIYADTKSIFTEPIATRDHTERMFASFGCHLIKNKESLEMSPIKRFVPTEIKIPADISSAAFFIVGAAIAKKSQICLRNIGINSTRNMIIKVLQRMGANIRIQNYRIYGNEPVADIEVGASQLQATEILHDEVPAVIDELPILMIAAACAKGTTHLRGAKELRKKESDRITAIINGLRQLGIMVHEFSDGMDVVGGEMTGGKINSYKDHRIAMAFSMASLVAKDLIYISDCKNIATSFPNFVQCAAEAGLNIQ